MPLIPRANFSGEREKTGNDLIDSILAKRDADLYEEEQTGPSVFIIKWGKTPRSSISFHFALLLVDDGADSYPTAGTVGTTFSWGSFEDNQLVKTGGTTKLKAYNFQREMEFGNTYEWIGRTRAPAEYIESVMNDFGDYYNLVTHNCRVVTVKVAKFITNNQYREEKRSRNVLNILKGLQQISSLGRAAGAGI
ncbi:hypothetical protein NW759_013392 [Fusarium solani]|nr:hypothetical protein NW759_013392 [Fusarium solani]